MRQFFKKYSKSFTLIELIIGVSIIIILSVIVIGNYEWGGYRVELQQTTHQVIQDMSKLRNRALSSPIDSPRPGIYIGISTSSYIIFEDLNGDYVYTSGEEKEVISLGENMIFQSTGCPESDPLSCPPASPPGAVNITFISPEPKIKIIRGGTETAGVMITIWSKKTDSTSSIFVGESGLIEPR